MAHAANEADMCPGGCGHPFSESAAMLDGEPVHTYRADLPIRCHACDEKIKQQELNAAQGEIVRERARMWAVVKVR